GISRRGGGGRAVERGPLWPPAGWSAARIFGQQPGYHGRPQGPSLRIHPTPAPTRTGFSCSLSKNVSRPYAIFSLLCFLFILILTLLGTRQRLQRVRKQHISLNLFTVFKATVRGHLAYTYHFCRHLTRYYTLPLLASSLLMP